ncbi:DUF1302 domain-containing protein [Ferrimonas lipolytica]|uniref:DUF1302 domain-containing protein n=1 Tax=Ferrimonas lipolytica TaxID=2724191 RepID=A0A6H1UBX3_9GAMM|nr:DUF1302 domain-containing protein [Ferrimonas lipolytica]QIZ76561.1 DUF1302 domain-containing protein [Ferrimonas lipolytica]
MTSNSLRFHKTALAVMVGTVLATPAQAVSFQWGDIEGRFDSTWTAGAAWRVEERDLDKIAKGNLVTWPGFGFTQDANGLVNGFNDRPNPADFFKNRGSFSANGDLSNQLYDKGDTFSETFKGTHELELVYDNMGFFARGMYFYDNALENDNFSYKNSLTGDEYKVCDDDKASEYACSDIRMLDYFFFIDTDIGEMPFSFRLGDQVVSWGESTLIAHGINQVNPVDLARLQAPGAELKEAFIPVGMAWASLGVTENLNIDAFYQYRWEETRLPAAGTYFASNDFAGAGGYANQAQLGFASNPDITIDQVLREYNKLATSVATIAGAGGDPSALGALAIPYATKVALVDHADKPSDQGQYGIKLGYFAPELNETEFGLYFMNYHSRRPISAGKASNFSDEAIASDLAYLGSVAAAGRDVNREDLLALQTFTHAQLTYQEDIKLYGASFNTTIGETSVAGEIAHRQDEPLQIDDVELLFAGMPEQLANAGRADLFTDLSQYVKPDGTRLMPGETAPGHILVDTTQVQTTFTHIFGPTFGANNFVMLAEVGGVWIHDMPSHSELRLNGPGTERAGSQGREDNLDALEYLHAGAEEDAFPDDFAWGYRVVAKADYANAAFGWNLSPRVVFSHDVKGTTPDPLFLFTEDKKSAAFTLSADYLSTWSWDLSYNMFFDGKGSTNAVEDKDFVSFNLKFAI